MMNSAEHQLIAQHFVTKQSPRGRDGRSWQKGTSAACWPKQGQVPTEWTSRLMINLKGTPSCGGFHFFPTWMGDATAPTALSYWPNWFGTTWICLILKVTHPVAFYASMAAHAHQLPVEQWITQREMGEKLVRVGRRSETDAVIGVVHILVIWFVCLRFGVCR